MNDPLADVSPSLRRWLTPEFVKALATVGHLVGNSERDFPHFVLDGGAPLTISRSWLEPRIGVSSVVVDPSQPWPPQPKYEFGDRATIPGWGDERAIVVGVDAGDRLDVKICYNGGDSDDWVSSSDLVPGWSD